MNKRLAELIAAKQKQKYSFVMADIRTRLRFALLKATVVAVRGFRGIAGQALDSDDVEMDIPSPYEAY